MRPRRRKIAVSGGWTPRKGRGVQPVFNKCSTSVQPFNHWVVEHLPQKWCSTSHGWL